jgi:hypothetical protein
LNNLDHDPNSEDGKVVESTAAVTFLNARTRGTVRRGGRERQTDVLWLEMLEEPIRTENETIPPPRQAAMEIDFYEKIATDRSGEKVTVRMPGRLMRVDKT